MLKTSPYFAFAILASAFIHPGEVSAQAAVAEAVVEVEVAPAEGGLVSEQMLGPWVVDVEALGEQLKAQMDADLAANPGADAAGAAMAKQMMEGMLEAMGQMTVAFTADEMVMVQGDEEMVAGYEVTSSDESECVIAATLDGDTKNLKVTITEGGIAIKEIGGDPMVMTLKRPEEEAEEEKE